MNPLKRLLIPMIIALSLTGTAVSTTGCASFGKKLKAFLSGEDPQQKRKDKVQLSNSFKKSPVNPPNVKRKYERVTSESLKESNDLRDKAGSLWVMEGQGAFLFSQNVIRMIGDPLPVNLEGEPKKQLEAKADVIRDLLERLRKRRQAAARRPAGARKNAGQQAANSGENGEENTEETQEPNTQGQNTARGSSDLSVSRVPTRVVERLTDGSYRVKGSQPFMIGSREYKVLVSGIVRPEDFSDQGVSASKLLDANFDIVSTQSKRSVK